MNFKQYYGDKSNLEIYIWKKADINYFKFIFVIFISCRASGCIKCSFKHENLIER